MTADELGELLAARDLYRAASGASAGPEHLECSGALALVYPQVPARELNRILGFGLDQPATEADLDALIDFTLQRGAPATVSLAPAAGPSLATIEGWLRRRGFAEGYPWQKFRHAGQPARPAATQLAIEETADGPEFAATLLKGYGMPPLLQEWVALLPGRPRWHCFVARDRAGGEAVAAGALYAERGIGWLGLAATLPEQRGRGAQGAILAARMARARALGCTEVVTETGVPGPAGPGPSYRNILRAGFVPAYVRPNWERAAR